MAKSLELNFQNFPKHENIDTRNVIKAPKDHYIVAFDFGQLEARGIATSSRDKVFCNAIWDDFDTHMFWTEKLIEAYPKILKEFDSKKEIRSDIKTGLVFAGFYGASEYSIATHYEKYGVPRNIIHELFEEYWDVYSGVKKWQKDLLDFYSRNGYIESLTGRRRRAPLSLNKIINFPIQSVCSYDICLGAGDRLSKLAYELDKPQYQYRINIHDDLTFYIPKKSLDEDIEFIAKEMCRVVWDWLIVPLEVECSIGTNWGKMEEIAKLRTTNFYPEFKKENFI